MSLHMDSNDRKKKQKVLTLFLNFFLPGFEVIQPQNKTNNPDTVFISCNFTANTGIIVDVRLNKVLPEKYVEACLLVLVNLCCFWDDKTKLFSFTAGCWEILVLLVWTHVCWLKFSLCFWSNVCMTKRCLYEVCSSSMFKNLQVFFSHFQEFCLLQF